MKVDTIDSVAIPAEYQSTGNAVRQDQISPSTCQIPPGYSGFSGVRTMLASLTMTWMRVFVREVDSSSLNVSLYSAGASGRTSDPPYLRSSQLEMSSSSSPSWE